MVAHITATYTQAHVALYNGLPPGAIPQVASEQDYAPYQHSEIEFTWLYMLHC